jgi:hypothetical protein
MDVIDKHLYQLNTISNIPPGKKISTAREFIVVEDDSTFQCVWRWKAGDERTRGILVICNIVHYTIELSTRIMESKYLVNGLEEANDLAMKNKRISELKKIRLGLLTAIRGIEHTAATYAADADTISPIKPLIGEINDNADVILTFLKALGESIN